MTVVRFALAVLMDLAASLAHAAGFQLTEVPGDGSRPPVRGAVWYPCARPPAEARLGPYAMSFAKDFRSRARNCRSS